MRLDPVMVRNKIRSAYGDEFDFRKFKERVLEKKKYWEGELRPLLPHIVRPLNNCNTVFNFVLDSPIMLDFVPS